MSNIELHLLDMVPVGPEGFSCILLQPEGRSQVVPIWTAEATSGSLFAYLHGSETSRRSTIESLVELLGELGGVAEVSIVSHHEGNFVFDVLTASGHSVEMNAADAVVVAENFGVMVSADEELLSSVAIFINQDSLREYTGVEFATPLSEQGSPDHFASLESGFAAVDIVADADFEEMMRSLGMDDMDLDNEKNEDEE